MPIQQLFTSRKVYNASAYVARKGILFYDEATGYLRLGDGSTPGGKIVGNLAIASTGTTAPINPYNGELWYNPTTKELWAYHNGAFRGTINVATTSTLGGIKAGPGVVIASDGSLSLDSTGIPFNFGDFYAFTNPGPSDGACLSSINADQDINLVSNGTGQINVVGEFHIHKTNESIEDALTTDPVFSVSSAGKIRVLAPNAGSTTGAIEIIGSSTYATISPNQTGVVLHVTGNTGMVSRNYLDGVNNYPLLVGRRYNGSATSPTNVKSGELIFRLVGQASTATGFETFGPCQIDWVATEDQGINNQGGELRFKATPNGSNAFSGIVTATTVTATGTTSLRFFGPLTGNVTGNVNATAVTATNFVGTLQTAAQPNITSVGTLTSGTIGAGFTPIANARLSNSTISGVALGGTLNALTAGFGLQFSTGTTYDGSAALTLNKYDAIVTPTVTGAGANGWTVSIDLGTTSGIVIVGAGGNFSGTITITGTPVVGKVVRVFVTGGLKGATTVTVSGLTATNSANGTSHFTAQTGNASVVGVEFICTTNALSGVYMMLSGAK